MADKTLPRFTPGKIFIKQTKVFQEDYPGDLETKMNNWLTTLHPDEEIINVLQSQDEEDGITVTYIYYKLKEE